MSKKRICAYCDADQKLTKEHIWPNCIIRRMPELNLKFSESNKLITTSGLVISDVCKECNNEKLSPLDSYFCSLYDSYFRVFRENKDSINFEYDYELLLRSLLKITYNSSRTVSRVDNEFYRFRSFILNGNDFREDIAIKLDFVKPSLIDENKVYPKSARCGVLDLKKKVEHFQLRAISVNSYYFYLIISKDEVFKSEEALIEFHEIIQMIPGTIINPNTVQVEVSVSMNEDTLSSHLPWINKNREKFEQFIKNNKSKG